MKEPLIARKDGSVSRNYLGLAIVCLALLLITVYLKNHHLIEHSVSRSTEEHNTTWDYLLFTQQWPISFCSQWTEEEKIPVDSCAFAKNKYAWTVHGLWPSISNSSSYPQFCRHIPFNVTSIESIVDELNEHWATIQKAKNGSAAFWKHEWLKHGTCAVQIPQLDTELKYFTLGLEWNRQYDLSKALASCSIYPSDSKQYHISEFVHCLEDSFDLKPQLNCVRDEILNRDILVEIRFCVDRNLNFASCDEFGAKAICNDEFIYPATVSQLSD